MKRIVLASGSPRRKELLAKLHIDFEIITSDVDENIDFVSPEEMVENLALRKAKAVFDSLDDNDLLVIGADTIVYYDGEVLGKPEDEEEARAMISMLSERTHQVYTGVALCTRIDGAISFKTFHDKTDVTFYPIDRFDIDAYIKTGSPMDKAGAYGIQDDFAIHVKKIEGDYNNVVGLPIAKLYQEIKALNL
ncbi:MAG: Maf family protein [Lachnospiraceae bacterium]|nr:Maf family protein [Lachnospiraceae bacterium]